MQVFFSAMQNGYAGNAKKGTIVELPGSRVITDEQGDFTVVDCYFVTGHSDYSFGTTVISHLDEPVWMMQYRGEYKQQHIPFLKRALQVNYLKSVFVGGRGPLSFYDSAIGLRYENHVLHDFFSFFMGREEIVEVGSCGGSKIVGWHEYSGRLLYQV